MRRDTKEANYNLQNNQLKDKLNNPDIIYHSSDRLSNYNTASFNINTNNTNNNNNQHLNNYN